LCAHGCQIRNNIMISQKVEYNIDEKVKIGPRSTTMVVFLKSSIFIPLTCKSSSNLKSSHGIQPPNIFEVNSSRISKIVNFHLIDLKFEEELHIWSLNWTTNYCWGQICLQVSCSARRLFLFVNRLQVTIPTRSSWNFTKCRGSLNWEAFWFWG